MRCAFIQITTQAELGSSFVLTYPLRFALQESRPKGPTPQSICFKRGNIQEINMYPFFIIVGGLKLRGPLPS